MHRIALALLVACGSVAPAPAPTPPAEKSAPTEAPTPQMTAGCTLLPQPSKPDHTSVEPDDMACTHGDAVYDCPTGFDGAPLGCQLTTAKGWWSADSTWCCPR